MEPEHREGFVLCLIRVKRADAIKEAFFPSPSQLLQFVDLSCSSLAATRPHVVAQSTSLHILPMLTTPHRPIFRPEYLKVWALSFAVCK